MGLAMHSRWGFSTSDRKVETHPSRANRAYPERAQKQEGRGPIQRPTPTQKLRTMQKQGVARAKLRADPWSMEMEREPTA
jgi:hypothetical protein